MPGFVLRRSRARAPDATANENRGAHALKLAKEGSGVKERTGTCCANTNVEGQSKLARGLE